ncbi:hypothetical protein [Rhodoplanes azumiensis]|uniref:Uncharacterized protein n=1 Tax=Rhodoplanes azumiensis TaxID=1897628 RepID=A0ABW5AMR9_9BRAD
MQSVVEVLISNRGSIRRAEATMSWQWHVWRWLFDGQRVVWSSVLLFVLPDCAPHVDPKIIAKLGGKADKRVILEEIYRLLGILDTKASALMRYNGVILAVATLMIRPGPVPPAAPPPYIQPIIYLTLFSILLCLFVVGVFWRFLDFVDPHAAAEAQIDHELDMIRRVLVLREGFYQLAWLLSAAVSVLLVMSLPHLVKAAGAG